MKIPTVENFLFCLELRLGGIVCGWLGIISSIIGAIGVLLAMIFGRKMIGDVFTPVNTQQIAGHGESTGAIIVGGIVALIFLGIYFYCSWKLLKGTQDRQHHQMKPYLIMSAIATILSALGIFALSISSLVTTIIYVYVWICIYSLYKMIESEGSSGRTTNKV